MNIFKRSIKYILVTLIFEKILKKDFASTLWLCLYQVAPYVPLKLLLNRRRVNKLRKDFNENLVIFFYLIKRIKRGTMLDVGSMNGGAFVPFMLHKYTIHAFEPDPNPAKWEILNKYAERKNVTLYNNAVSDKDDQVLEFYSSDESQGISSLSPFTSNHKPIAKVSTVTLNKFIKEQQLNKINYLKIDTEGYDLFVLKGFPWEKLKADVVLCEFENKKTVPLGYTFEDMGNYLLEQEYEVYFTEWAPIVKYGGNHKFLKLCHYPMKLSDENGWGNFIAFKKEHDEFKSILDQFI